MNNLDRHHHEVIHCSEEDLIRIAPERLLIVAPSAEAVFFGVVQTGWTSSNFLVGDLLW